MVEVFISARKLDDAEKVFKGVAYFAARNRRTQRVLADGDARVLCHALKVILAVRHPTDPKDHGSIGGQGLGPLTNLDQWSIPRKSNLDMSNGQVIFDGIFDDI